MVDRRQLIVHVSGGHKTFKDGYHLFKIMRKNGSSDGKNYVTQNSSSMYVFVGCLKNVTMSTNVIWENNIKNFKMIYGAQKR